MNKQAPDFTLKNTENKEVSLSDFKGKQNVVLLFFPLAFSGVCTKELCTTRDNLKIYQALNAEIIAISIDSTYALKAFKESQSYNFTLLSDFNKEVSKAYNAYYETFHGMNGVSKRSAFVINKKGEIVYTEILDDSSQIPDFDKIQEALAAVQ